MRFTIDIGMRKVARYETVELLVSQAMPCLNIRPDYFG
jgi:hypothetical protein